MLLSVLLLFLSISLVIYTELARDYGFLN